ncbi:MAG: Leucine Rich repeats (2 copies) [Roseibaca calidilacus]|uniref:Leucine Rich repeat-containing protein n=1 Tax=Roseibaca calidilacus TaxID=1666912 RepID=A0A0P7Z2H7_9RHOB|nr:leucine-rich repeat domain-containing protein [Roseibaca calidilacus]KPP95885.1 MAG: Leucine Rich repeats (2 copies) [Roseibaca calidilacus]CUX81549.1 Leucine Rich repeat-containing protein [Roseibaca calidilacus]
MDAAEQAYEAARAEIARVKATVGDTLYFDAEDYRALTTLPPEIAELTGLETLVLRNTQITDLAPLAGLTRLQTLVLRNTQITDLAPLAGLTGLKRLDLCNTQITDLAPLAGLTGLKRLNLHSTQITDLRPIEALHKLRTDILGLTFQNTPAADHDAKLTELAELEDTQDRTRQTLAYLRSLPPWPDPYTPAATPDGSPPKPIGGVPERKKIKTAQTQIQHLIHSATVTRISAQNFATQIEAALKDMPASYGNRLAEPFQTMLDFAEVLRNLAPDSEPPSDPLDRAHLELRIAQLETLVDRLTRQLADETLAREAAEALAKKEGFWSKYRQSAGWFSGAATVSIATVGVPTAAIYFLGVEHPLVQAFLTAMGRLPKS